jgi:hypothetical protein
MSIGSRSKALMRQLGRSKQASPPNKLPRIGEPEIMLTGQHEAASASAAPQAI